MVRRLVFEQFYCVHYNNTSVSQMSNADLIVKISEEYPLSSGHKLQKNSTYLMTLLFRCKHIVCCSVFCMADTV